MVVPRDGCALIPRHRTGGLAADKQRIISVPPITSWRDAVITMRPKPTERILMAGVFSFLILAVLTAGCTSPDAGTPVPVTTPGQPSPDPVSLTINTARKAVQVGSFTTIPGNIFLVLDITVKNNARENGYYLTERSFSMSIANSATMSLESITSKVARSLDSPLKMPTMIEQDDQRTGQVVFSISDFPGKYSYTINLLDNDATIASSASVDLG